MKGAEHHLHMRRMLYKKLEQYPHPKPLIRLVDYLVFLGGVIGPIFSIPQLLQVWVDRVTSGLSLYTWTSYFVMSVIWLVYGIVHREKLIIFANAVFAVINFMIVLGIILF